MTSRDAITVIDQIRKVIKVDPSWLESATKAVNEAIDMAILALEKQIPKKP